MIRVVVQELALFLLPFLLCAVVLMLQRKRVLDIEHWSRNATWLAIAGLVLVIASFLAIELLGERNTGRYVPPHMKDGRPVPGGFQ